MHSSSLSRAVSLGAVLIVPDCAILFRHVLSLDLASMDFIFCLCLLPVLIYALVQCIRMHQTIQKSNFLTKDVLSCLLPRLTLQPLVENAIYHGLETRMEGGCISISLEQTAEYIVVRISDNGVGMEESQ